MGVRVREKPVGSGVWWLFINHQGLRKSKKIGTDKKQAFDVAEKVRAKLVLGELNVEKVNDKGPNFRTLAEKWLALPHDWKESTRESYAGNLKNHVYPVYGKRPIDRITRKEIKLFFDDLYTKGLKVGTLKLLRAPFRQVFSYAVESEIINTNPFDYLRMNYKSTTLDIQPLDERDAAKMLEQGKAFMDGKYYPPILLLLRTGMRIGEVQAIKWDHIDFDNRQIEVKRSWRKGLTTSTKNKKNRRVDMTPHLTETLLKHRTAQKRQALKDGKPFSELVFTGDRDDNLNRKSLKYALDQCLEAASLEKIRIHDLRHSYATIRLMRGHNVGDVSYQLGHSSIKITYDVYAHWIPGSFKSEVDDLDSPHLNCLKMKVD